MTLTSPEIGTPVTSPAVTDLSLFYRYFSVFCQLDLSSKMPSNFKSVILGYFHMFNPLGINENLSKEFDSLKIYRLKDITSTSYTFNTHSRLEVFLEKIL